MLLDFRCRRGAGTGHGAWSSPKMSSPTGRDGCLQVGRLRVEDLPHMRHPSNHLLNRWMSKWENVRRDMIIKAVRVNSVPESGHTHKKQLENLREGPCLENSGRDRESDRQGNWKGRKETKEESSREDSVYVLICGEVRVCVGLKRAASAMGKVLTTLPPVQNRGWQMTKGHNRWVFVKVGKGEGEEERDKKPWLNLSWVVKAAGLSQFMEVLSLLLPEDWEQQPASVAGACAPVQRWLGQEGPRSA